MRNSVFILCGKILNGVFVFFRLNDVLEVAEDIAIDIPKIWDYLGEVLAPVLARKHISLLILKKPPTSLVKGR